MNKQINTVSTAGATLSKSINVTITDDTSKLISCAQALSAAQGELLNLMEACKVPVEDYNAFGGACSEMQNIFVRIIADRVRTNLNDFFDSTNARLSL